MFTINLQPFLHVTAAKCNKQMIYINDFMTFCSRFLLLKRGID